MTRPDLTARGPAELARIFEYFGEVDCPDLGARLYQSLCPRIARDADLLALAARAPTTQPAPNLLFGAVHYLLLGGEEHALRAWYPALAGSEARDAAEAFPAFRDFCGVHRERIARLIETRLTQTNVVQRCTALLPAFARVHEGARRRPLALIEIGPSAGLNLRWDRFAYAYTCEEGARGGASVVWGDPASPVRLPCGLRGGRPLPALPKSLPVASRTGVDINPVDVADPDAVQWLRALIWPEHVERHERLARAIEIARQVPATLLRGDAARELPRLIGSAPAGAAVCIYGTHTLYQFPREALLETLRGMQDASRSRPVDFVSMEGTAGSASELRHTRYRDGGREVTLAARCSPHGRWLEWLD